MALAAFSDKPPFRLDGRQYQCEASMDSLLFASAFVPSTTRNAPNAFLIERRRFRRASIFGRKLQLPLGLLLLPSITVASLGNV